MQLILWIMMCFLSPGGKQVCHCITNFNLNVKVPLPYVANTEIACKGMTLVCEQYVKH